MDVRWAGTEREAFISTTAVETTAQATAYDSTYVRCAIRPGGASATDFMETPVFSSYTDFWLHGEMWRSTTISSPPIIFYNTTPTAVFRLNCTGTSTFQPQYWDGATWQNIGTTYTLPATTRVSFDIRIVCGGSGSFELYINNTLTSSGSASMTAVTNIAQVRFQNGATTTSSMHFSQLFVADESTVNHKYYSKPPTGNGANTAWTNDYTAVDELALSDSDYIESTVADDVETFTGAALTLSGAVKAVVVSARALNVATGPQNMQLAVRVGGTNYFSSTKTLTTGFAPYVECWNTDPSTSAAWTTSAAGDAATEFGVKSIT